MDEIAMLLDRAVTSQLASCLAPPVATIEAASRRLDVRRSLVSVTVVVLLVIGSVIGLASAGYASQPRPGGSAAVAASVSTAVDVP